MYWVTVYIRAADGSQRDVCRLGEPYSSVEAARDRARTLKTLPPPTHYLVANEDRQTVEEGAIHT